jgi:hypothetical protein
MALRLLSLVFTLALLGLLATTMRSRLHATDKGGVATPTNLLQQAGAIVERSHQITGTYAGVSAAADSPLRLVSGDASGYCLQLIWLNKPYHLRGPGGKAAPGAC